MRVKHLPIAKPCHEDWDAMDRVARGRFCTHCDKSVFDLSSMTQQAARAILDEHKGQRLCIAYMHDGAGNIRFARSRPAISTRVAATTLLAAAVAACAPHDNIEVHDTRPPAAIEVDIAQADPVTPYVWVDNVPDPEPGGAVAVEPSELSAVKGEMVAPEPPPQPDPRWQQIKGGVG